MRTQADSTVNKSPDAEPPAGSLNPPPPTVPTVDPIPASNGATLLLRHEFKHSELIIGLVGAVGTDLDDIISILRQRLKVAQYNIQVMEIADEIIPLVAPYDSTERDAFARIMAKMTAGNTARNKTQDNSILALGAASRISQKREIDGKEPKHAQRQVYIIKSLKHPDEVHRLREIYPEGFYLLGVHDDAERREADLINKKRMKKDQAKELIARDEDEHLQYGQRVTDTFHLSDFFVRLDADHDRLQNSLWRIVDILLGHPHKTPTFEEYGMFLAFGAALGSADLSRQVGAVIAVDEQVVATGANDCPRFGGGHYWPTWINNDILDHPKGRDHTRGWDSNKVEQQRIIDQIVGFAVKSGADETELRASLEKSRIRDLTEFGRVVHAEMDALLSCARLGISVRGGTLYSTTFPCHNCAKHIIAAGITRVVYIEPYPRSKAPEFHDDCITLGFQKPAQEEEHNASRSIRFEPFVGVGPRRFFDFFSMRLGSGRELKRKDDSGKAITWEVEDGFLRLQMLPFSYLNLESAATRRFLESIDLMEK